MSGQQPVEEVLEQCLARLQSGEPASACLEDYPELADELGPLLEVAQSLQAMAATRSAPPASLAAGRERFLRQAAEARSKRRPLKAWGHREALLQQLAGFFSPVLRRGLASTVIAAAVLFALLAGTTMMASANSLPGDALYPVKRAAESVRLALTLDQAGRATVQRALDQRRIDETQAVLRQHKVTEVSFRGLVDSFDGSTLIAAGLTVQIQPTTQFVGPRPSPGQLVAVVALSQEDGSLLARRIETLPGTPTPTATAQPPALAPSDTPASMVTGWVAPPATRKPPTATPPPSPGATAAATATAQLTPTVSVAPPSVATLTPRPPREVELRLEGLITRVGPGPWQIAGYDVLVTAQTRLDEHVAKAEIGAWARVRAIHDAAGNIVALQISIQRGAESPGELVEFQGTIEAFSDTQWTVAGQYLEITPATKISGQPQVGWQAEVRARRQPQGTLRATEITVRAPQEIPVEFVGVIEELAADHWLVSGQLVRLDAQTAIHGNAQVGRRAEVQGVELADGTIRALTIQIRDGKPITPTAPPTATPPPMPTPEATATPPVPTSTATLEPGDSPALPPTPTPTPEATIDGA